LTEARTEATERAAASGRLAALLPFCSLVTAAVVLIVVPVSVALKLLVVATLLCVSGLAAARLNVAERPSFHRYAEILFWAQVLAVCLVLVQLDRPWVALFTIGTVVLALEAWRRSGLARLVALYAAVGAFGLLTGEVILAGTFGRLFGAGPNGDVALLTDTKADRRLPDGASFWVPDAVRGYFGRPNTLASVTRSKGRKTVFRARYTLDETGARTVSAASSEPIASAPRTVVFFGDSFAFGEGVDDVDTTPAFLEALSDGTRRCVNLSFIGFGPHQALASIEERLELQKADGPADGVFYAAFDPQRAVGLSHWDIHGPRYTLSPEAEPVRTGPFDAHRGTKMLGVLNKSALFRNVVTPRLRSARQEELYVSLMKRCSELFRARHGGRFLVFAWGGKDDPSYVRTMKCLEQVGVEVLSMEHVFAKSGGTPGQEMTIPGEGHPSSKAHEMVALAIRARLEQGIQKRPEM
jgi:hypothetical protein